MKTKAEERLRGPQRAAIVLASLGEAAGAEILKLLSEDEVDMISQALARLGTIEPQLAEGLLEEFHQTTVAQDFLITGGFDYAKKMLYAAFGPEAARRLLDRVSKALGSGVATFDGLQKADPQQLAKVIAREHPQTVALIVAHLNPTQAATVLANLPVEMQADIAVRVANLDRISPEVVQKIASVVCDKMKDVREVSRDNCGGVRAVAEMFNRLDGGSSQHLLAQIETTDPNLFDMIRKLMFVFDDLMQIDAQSMKEIVAKVDRKVLTTALKGTSEQLRGWITASMSQRGAEMLKEDIESMGPVKIRDVETAQQTIIGIVRALEAEGVISLKGAAGEQYVV